MPASSPASPIPRFLACLGLLAVGGCCPLAQYFCGPDRSEWIQPSFATHPEAVATVLEAFRREDVPMIYRSLSEWFKEQSGVAGVLEAEIGWQKVREQIPGVHMLGSAQRRGWQRWSATREGFPRVRYHLDVYGHRFELTLVRQPYVTVSFETDGPIEPRGDYVRSLERFVSVDPGEDLTSVGLAIPDLDLPEDVDAAAIRSVAAGYDWKVDGIRALVDDD